MAHEYNEDSHFDSYTKHARKAADARALARMKAAHGAVKEAPPEGALAPQGDGAPEMEAPAEEGRPADENGPHPDGCRCPECKSWVASKGGDTEGAPAELSPEDAAALLGGG
jgi:hypothetical protein